MTDAGAAAEPATSTTARIVVDGRPIEAHDGDTIAIAVLRAGEVPGRGGTLCLAGDCGNCLAVVDGVAYVRTCQVPARAGTVVVRHPADGNPPLPLLDAANPVATPVGPEIVVERRSAAVAVIGAGDAGRAAAAREGHEALLLDAAAGEEVVAVYPGPTVVARTPRGMLHVDAERVVVATGAAEIQPVCPGNDLHGILTPRAAERLRAAEVALHEPVVTVGPELVRFEGDEDGRVRAVVTRDADGAHRTADARTVIADLGLASRDMLARVAGPTVPRTIVGAAAEDHPLPPAPTEADAVVCRCMDVTVANLEEAWSKGFTELELLKRATLAGIGTCQGGACLPHVRSWIAARTGSVPDPFTARPASRQITLGEAAADTTVDVFRRTPLHEEHIALGGQLDRFGGWWRPWTYGDHLAEYWA
ncbi:MAG TPA: 2Fe-2S iron-sulfur cluster-binding protein, partial [Candidatus Limnocylindrales bacterium]|nr:2Fe-2S iron-sulfur cluster-binding protein [Candidatus Limnocylindrales bacterium]